MKSEIKTLFTLILTLIFLVGTLVFMSFNFPITTQAIQEPIQSQYSFTKAICEGNACQDFEIACKNEQLLYQKPVSKKALFPENWVDLRTEEDKTELC